MKKIIKLEIETEDNIIDGSCSCEREIGRVVTAIIRTKYDDESSDHDEIGFCVKCHRTHYTDSLSNTWEEGDELQKYPTWLREHHNKTIESYKDYFEE